MKKALVTGGAGFIGSHLVDKLIKEGWRVGVLDNFSSGRIENIEHLKSNSKVEILRGDLKNSKEIDSVRDIDTAFHYAANPEVRVSTTEPETHLKENVVATFNLLEAMRKRDIKEIVFASSSSVYGEPDRIPVCEEDPIRPVSVYGATKAACENIIHAYSRLYGIKAVVLRYANVVGPRLRHGVIYDLLIKLKVNPNVLEVLGDGGQVRSYVYINDAIEATMLAYKKALGNYDVYNIASKDWLTVDNIVNIIIEELRLSKTRIVYKPVLHGVGWPGDVKKIALSIDKMASLGFKPSKSSKQAVKETVRNLGKELKHRGN